jgi:mannitol/fructose-specific phosphotransferase system IIA component (Ntr-type)
MDCDALYDLLWKREEQFTTRVSPTIAIPHVVVPGLAEPAVVFGISHNGVLYESGDEGLVQILVLLLSDRESHIDLLSQLARLLQRDLLAEQLLAAGSLRAAQDILVRGPSLPRRISDADGTRISRATFNHALALAAETGARAVVLNADSVGSLEFIEKDLSDVTVYLVTHDPDQFPHTDYGFREIVTIPFKGLVRSNLVELSLLFVLSRGLLGKGDKVFSVFGMPGAGYLDTIIHTDVGWEFRIFFAIHGAEHPGDLEESVFSRAIHLAHELAMEGREGKPVGSLLVIGDYERVAGYCQQMVINPFHCYPEEDRNILDPSLEETIKEYSRIDGAFIVRGDGVIISAGTYLRTDVPFHAVESGLGARHAAAATISKVTDALCVVISESTKKISLFRGGERVMVI